MSPGEIVVVVVGLGLGYLVVSLLMGGKENRGSAAGTDRSPQAGSAHEAASGERPGAQAAPTRAIEDREWTEVLGVPRSASEDEIRTAYRGLMSQYHPDKVASLGQELRDLAERKTKEIGAAYSTAMRENGFSQ